MALTFPRCDVGRDVVQQRLEAEFPGQLAGYAIAQEHHEDGGLHLHVALRFKEKKNFKDPNCFDFLTGQHGNYQSSKYPKKWINYVLKVDESALVVGDIKEDLTWAEIMNQPSWSKAKDQLMEYRPRDLALNGKRIRENYFMHRDMEKAKKPYTRNERPENCIFFGDAGAGKSYACEQKAIDNSMSMQAIDMQQLKAGWYTDWEEQDICWLDDFRGEVMKPHEFLALLDNTSKTKPVKGGKVDFNPKAILITSPDHPINWWPKWYAKNPNNWAQVKRRLDRVVHVHDRALTEVDLSEIEMWKNKDEMIKVGFEENK